MNDNEDDIRYLSRKSQEQQKLDTEAGEFDNQLGMGEAYDTLRERRNNATSLLHHGLKLQHGHHFEG